MRLALTALNSRMPAMPTFFTRWLMVVTAKTPLFWLPISTLKRWAITLAIRLWLQPSLIAWYIIPLSSISKAPAGEWRNQENSIVRQGAKKKANRLSNTFFSVGWFFRLNCNQGWCHGWLARLNMGSCLLRISFIYTNTHERGKMKWWVIEKLDGFSKYGFCFIKSKTFSGSVTQVLLQKSMVEKISMSIIITS